MPLPSRKRIPFAQLPIGARWLDQLVAASCRSEHRSQMMRRERAIVNEMEFRMSHLRKQLSPQLPRRATETYFAVWTRRSRVHTDSHARNSIHSQHETPLFYEDETIGTFVARLCLNSDSHFID
jgi:hypothetical protein